jgi:hypothetical protein
LHRHLTAFVTEKIMDTTFDTAMPYRLTQLALDDDQLLLVAAYMRDAASLARFRRKAVIYNVLLLFATQLSARVIGYAPAAFESTRYLFDIIAKLAPVLAALGLLVTLIGGWLLNRQLAASTLPEEAKRSLRRLTSGLAEDILRRCRHRICLWFQGR